jgi:hypothetical protein
VTASEVLKYGRVHGVVRCFVVWDMNTNKKYD